MEAFPNLPEGAPQWEGRVTVQVPLKREEQETLAVHLINQHIAGETPHVFMGGVLSNKGRHDDKSIATIAAVLYHRRLEWGHTEHILGEK